jgi:hypothetical protein
MSYAPPSTLQAPAGQQRTRPRRIAARHAQTVLQRINAVLHYDIAVKVWCLCCPQLGIFTEGETREEAIAACLDLVPEMQEDYGFHDLGADDFVFTTGMPFLESA